MSALLDLAARCEAATGPVRLLDALIGRIPAAEFLGVSFETVEPMHGCTKYTASLDAAMSLADWNWLDEWGYNFTLERWNGKWSARVDQSGDECGNGDTVIAAGATRELAACNLFLRLRAIAGAQ